MKRRRQTGEAMVVMMALMLIVMWLSRGHMGMMGGGFNREPQEATQAENAGVPASASPEVPVEAGAECDLANPRAKRGKREKEGGCPENARILPRFG